MSEPTHVTFTSSDNDQSRYEDHDHDFGPDLASEATCSVCGLPYHQWTLEPLAEALNSPAPADEVLVWVRDALRRGDDPLHILAHVENALAALGFDPEAADEGEEAGER